MKGVPKIENFEENTVFMKRIYLWKLLTDETDPKIRIYFKEKHLLSLYNWAYTGANLELSFKRFLKLMLM